MQGMSRKFVHSSTLFVPAAQESVRRVLLDPESYPAWNPAFTRVGARDADGVYPVAVNGLLMGTLKLTDARDTIALHIAIPGLIEKSHFTLEPHEGGTTVTHVIEQSGFLTRIIGEQEASLVPGKRLSRLSARLRHR